MRAEIIGVDKIEARKQEDCRSPQGWMTPGKQHLPDTTGPRPIWPHRDCGGMHRACTGSSQMVSQDWEGTRTQSSNLAISNWQPLEKKESVFLNGVSQERLTTLKGGPHAQQQTVDGQHEINSVAGLWIWGGGGAGLTILYFGICFHLSGPLLISFYIFMVLCVFVVLFFYLFILVCLLFFVCVFVC